MIDDETTLEWGTLGSPAYYAAKNGTIVAILYWDRAQPGELDGAGGEPIITEPGWFLVSCEDPSHHLEIPGPPLMPGMAEADLIEATHMVFSVATETVMLRFGED